MNFEFPTSLIGENEFTYCIFLTQNRVILMSKTWIFDFNIWVGERERVFISNKLFMDLSQYNMSNSIFRLKCNIILRQIGWFFNFHFEIYSFKNLFTRYTCPFPVTRGVLTVIRSPFGFVIVLFLISNIPASTHLCIGWL